MHQLFMLTQHGMEGMPRLVQHGLQVIVGASCIHKDEHFSLSIEVQLVSTGSFPGSAFKIKAGAILKSGEQISEFGIQGREHLAAALHQFGFGSEWSQWGSP